MITYAVENHLSAQYVRLRSANRSNAHNTWNVNSSGNINNNNAWNANRFSPIAYIFNLTVAYNVIYFITISKEPNSLPLGKQHRTDASDLYLSLPMLVHEEQHMKSYIIDPDQLFDSMMKCKNTVSWKPSVKAFVLNGEKNIQKMNERLTNGTWINGKPKPILITYPKRREGLSISFKDRVYQRSINDNSLYPNITRSFIYANCACQKGKGTDFARSLLKKYLWRYFCKYGNQGYVMQIDIHGYYANLKHNYVNLYFKKSLESSVSNMAIEILENQYAGSVGYNPGSQMVQIAGIAFLNDLDHYIKEVLKVKYYIRYMDDLIIIHNNKEEIQQYMDCISIELNKLGLSLNEKKSKIQSLSKDFLYLGFVFRITSTGKIIMTLNPSNIKHWRRKLKRLVLKAKRGEIQKCKIEEAFDCWKANAMKGNSYKLISRMEKYYQELWRTL